MAPHSSTLLPGKSHGWRSLVGCSPWGLEELDTTEQLHFHFLLLCIGEGNGNPLQCSCLENPRDRGAWWAAVYGSHRVGHNWTDLAAVAAANTLYVTGIHLFQPPSQPGESMGAKASQLEKEMATHSNILAWKIPWTEEPGRLQSMGSQRVRYDWVTNTQNISITN